jgi:uncharacterized protein (DUF924 family)
MSGFEEILEFWLGDEPLTPTIVERLKPTWFAADKKLNDTIRERFEPEYRLAKAGDSDLWCASARGRLALILLLDPFARRMFEGTSEMFSADRKALSLCREGIAEGADRALGSIERAFFYQPLAHAEEQNAQLASVRLYTKLVDDGVAELRPMLQKFLKLAKQHQGAIKRFERFPQRNESMHRESTSEERQYLRTPSSRF